MTRNHLTSALTFALTTSLAAIIGPRIGEALTPSDSEWWQLLPWGLLVAVWIVLIVWMRRSRRDA